MTKRTLVRNQKAIDKIRKKAPQITQEVADYYNELHGTKDLKTQACCTLDAPPENIQKYLKHIPQDLLDHDYGCGFPYPEMLRGLNVADLACGPGKGAYILSGLVGSKGSVTGIDILEKHIQMAKAHQETMRKRFNHQESNVRFAQGMMEDIAAAGITPNSLDLVISNCVFNLSPELGAVMDGVFTALKPGGELYFSDIFASERLPEDLKKHKVMRGECISGALYENDFRNLLKDFGINDYRIMSRRSLEITDKAIAEKVEGVRFESVTVRAFNLQNLDTECEDYGQGLIYKGTIPGNPNQFVLDDHHTWKTGKVYEVCENSLRMVRDTRFKKHFKIIDEGKGKHYGQFDCAPSPIGDGDGGCC